MNITRALTLARHPVLVANPKMIQYLIGTHFEIGERFLGLLIQDNHATLFLNKLFPYENDQINIVRYGDEEDPIPLVSNAWLGDTLKVDHALPSGFLLRLMKMRPLCDYHLDTMMDQIRSIKDEHEIELMRQASELNDMVMTKVPALLKVGVSEIDVADKITHLFNEVSDGCSFKPIVAFGDHASDPHAVPSDRVLKEGEAIVVDMGCIYRGYCSDMTRTFFIGHNPMKKVYDTVVNANLAAIVQVKPGVTLGSIDHAARSIIHDAGFGPYFIHRTGHGIGTSVHEPYPVSTESEVICREGMIFSIEPGIYLPGIGGVRIEDLVLVTRNGVEVLNTYPKHQEIIEA
jgi:Xaa-Pro dipeptidase